MLAKEGDIVWSGKNGGHNGGSDYHIRFLNYRGADRLAGCWCPAEAVEFLRAIGVHIIKTKTYSSGYEACGCLWSGFIEPLTPSIQGAYQAFCVNNKIPNKLFKDRLEVYEGDN